MSEQALKPAPSGATSTTGGAATGNYPALFSGKAEPAAGKELPVVAVAKEDMERLVQELNAGSRSIGRDLHFQVEMGIGYAVIEVLDSETGEVIRQIPQDKVALDLSNNGSVQIRLFDDLV
ncbi:MAG: flagellar protein FlaG [Gammaproteobacteria bacterium]